MIITYKEALKRAFNEEWFKSMFKEEEICSDEEVNKINELVLEVGEKYLFEYFCIDEDMFLQKEYMDDLVDYLEEIKNSK